MRLAMQPLDPLTRTLFTCLSPASSAADVRAALADWSDWDQMLQLATAHRVAPLLLSQLRRHDAVDRLPAPSRLRLEQQYLAVAARGSRVQTELLRITRRFDALGIAVLPMRGPVLAQRLYPDPVGRQSDDLDLLVRRVDLPRAQHALQTDGYDPVDPAPPAIEPSRIAAGGACVMQHAATRLQVDLSWTLLPRHFSAPLTLEALSPHLVTSRLGERALSALDRETELLLLCAHGGKHLWSRHAWIVDVAMLLARSNDWPWEEVLHRARAMGFARMLGFGLAWAQCTCGVALADEVTDAVARDPAVARLCDALAANFARDPAWFPRDDRRRAQLQLLTRERARDRWRYLWRRALLPSANDWRAWPLPASLWPLYLVLRPLRLAVHAGRRLR